MKIVSLVLKFLPEHIAEVRAGILAVPGAAIAYAGGEGLMIVLIEDGEGYAVSDSILQLHRVPHLMSVTLSYEYSDEAPAFEEA